MFSFEPDSKYTYDLWEKYKPNIPTFETMEICESCAFMFI